MPVRETEYAKVGGKGTVKYRVQKNKRYNDYFKIICEISQGEKINDNCFEISNSDGKSPQKEHCKREHIMRYFCVTFGVVLSQINKFFKICDLVLENAINVFVLSFMSQPSTVWSINEK